MKTFRNIHWSKRDYECTNVVACLAQQAPNENYTEMRRAEFDAFVERGAQQLWIENDVRYFGWL